MKILSLFKSYILIILRSKGKQAFLKSLDTRSRILDVGCGNKSVISVKSVLPFCDYTGIDVGDYNQNNFSKSLMNEYIIVESKNFSSKIGSLNAKYDAVISSHNLEHCDDRKECLSSMMKVVRKGGVIFLSFPCEESLSYPNRHGTLNYYDDETHQGKPPNFDNILYELKKHNFSITYSIKRYQPFILRCIGFILEPFSKYKQRVLIGTWEYYGFESIIHAKKNE